MGEPFKPLNGGDSPLDMNERSKAETTCAFGHIEIAQLLFVGEPFKPLNGGDSPLDMNERSEAETTCAFGHIGIAQLLFEGNHLWGVA